MRELTVNVTETISYEVTIEVEDDVGEDIVAILRRHDRPIAPGILSWSDNDAIDEAVAKALNGNDAWVGATVDERTWEIVGGWET